MNYMTLNHDQVFAMTSVDPYRHSETIDHVAERILSLFATAKLDDHKDIPAALKKIIGDSCRVSIGQALEKLHSTATTGKELDGDHDGLDALCYHLGGSQVENAQKALHAIMGRFAELTRGQEEKANLQRQQRASATT